MRAALAARLDEAEARLASTGLPERLGIRAPQHVMLVGHGHSLISMLALQTVHPRVGGNKWFKLKYRVEAALRAGAHTLVSCGGAHSNHLRALAALCEALQLNCRAHVIGLHDTPTVQALEAAGVRLERLDRVTMNHWRGSPPVLPAGEFWIAEGGRHPDAVLGCASIARLPVWESVDEVHVACGTGTTLAGLRLGLPSHVHVVGWNTHRGDWLAEDVAQAMAEVDPQGAAGPWDIRPSPVRFGPLPEDAHRRARSLALAWGVPLDPVYMPRVLLGLQALRENSPTRPCHRMIVHGGGDPPMAGNG